MFTISVLHHRNCPFCFATNSSSAFRKIILIHIEKTERQKQGVKQRLMEIQMTETEID